MFLLLGNSKNEKYSPSLHPLAGAVINRADRILTNNEHSPAPSNHRGVFVNLGKNYLIRKGQIGTGVENASGLLWRSQGLSIFRRLPR